MIELRHTATIGQVASPGFLEGLPQRDSLSLCFPGLDSHRETPLVFVSRVFVCCVLTLQLRVRVRVRVRLVADATNSQPLNRHGSSGRLGSAQLSSLLFPP